MHRQLCYYPIHLYYTTNNLLSRHILENITRKRFILEKEEEGTLAQPPPHDTLLCLRLDKIFKYPLNLTSIMCVCQLRWGNLSLNKGCFFVICVLTFLDLSKYSLL